MQNFFRFQERGTNLRTEVIAGCTTFVTMAYIIFVNPAILAQAGVPFEAAVTATTLGAALMSVAMGVITNRPIALASGMGINATLAFSVIGFQQAKVPWQVGMGVIFIEGVVILLLVFTGLREVVMDAIPLNLKRAIGVGIGLFISVIGLNAGGLIAPAPQTLVTLGNFTRPYVWVTLIGLFASVVLMGLRIKGDILWGILIAGVAALVLGVADPWPRSAVQRPNFQTFFAIFGGSERGMFLLQAFAPALTASIFALMLTDFFDTMGTVVAIGEQAAFVSPDGKVAGIKQILLVDSAAAAVGGLFGASSITSYVESAAGVAEGGRTGLTPIVTGILFVAAAFFAPVAKMIGGGFMLPADEHYAALVSAGFRVPSEPPHFVYPITAGALVVVGFLMMRAVRDIPWDDIEDALPAFLTIVGIPLTYNISYGMGFGFISFTLIKLFRGKGREVHPLMYFVSAAFLFAIALAGFQARE